MNQRKSFTKSNAPQPPREIKVEYKDQKSRSEEVSNKSEEDSKPTGNYTLFSSKIFKGNKYMEKFITEVKTDKYSFQYLRCEDNKGKKKEDTSG